MFKTLLTVLPLDLAATLSPGILALTLFLLGSKKNGIPRILALLGGAIFTATIIAVAGFFLGSLNPSQAKPGIISELVDIVLGIILILFGIKVFFGKENRIKLNNDGNKIRIIKWFAIGVVVNITNFDAVLLSFAAAHEVGRSSLAVFDKLFIVIFNMLFFILPITLPLTLTLLFPRIADKILTKLNGYVIKYSKYIVSLLFIVFGIYLLSRVIKIF